MISPGFQRLHITEEISVIMNLMHCRIICRRDDSAG